MQRKINYLSYSHHNHKCYWSKFRYCIKDIQLTTCRKNWYKWAIHNKPRILGNNKDIKIKLNIITTIKYIFQLKLIKITFVINENISGKLDCWNKDIAVNKQENILTIHIICTLVAPYSTNNALCQVLVKLSNNK